MAAQHGVGIASSCMDGIASRILHRGVVVDPAASGIVVTDHHARMSIDIGEWHITAVSVAAVCSVAVSRM